LESEISREICRYEANSNSKHEEEVEDELGIKMLKMVVEEESIMEIMVHERIVKFIMFEIESWESV
jgi:hypothetical protein